ncbi:Regulatory protein AfsR [Agromyces sp. NDB4Y10]|uniref:nSTAND1 domain-containing NTPase n=1 Tax=Agromyces sp. NDB4Y10 TaxID=1775951 RepID=UPI0007B1C2F8|nr:BTAD domain-containing putative transcriptional regulator [Agromyces sp. NDB4Y10]KZE94569.1 Regulatory protein AfsR [Agromyces sp. NDB4Y10]
MGIRVLGPLRLDDAALNLRERMVLAVLVLRNGQPVPADEIASAVWGDDRPHTWQKQVQAAIGLVRKAVGRSAIETVDDGYELRIDAAEIDAARFERLAAAAREHLVAGDPVRSLDAADRALGLWHGTAFAELSAWLPAAAESARLEEARMDLEEVRLDAWLRAGRHTESVPMAETMVREAPLRERRWTMLATALYRSDRQADALAAVRAARERLDEELGVEPGEELQDMELAILRHDPSLRPSTPVTVPSADCPYPGLRSFAAEDEEHYFGRDADVRAALARLARAPFLAVSGASGSGKSSLVLAGVVPVLRRRGDRVFVLLPSADLERRIRDAVDGAHGRTALVIDQFEEVFHARGADADGTAAAIARAAAAGVVVVLVVRSDFLDRCAALADLGPLMADGVHLVGPMGREALRDAIEQPARRAGLRLEPGLAELMLRDAAGAPGALPLLAHALVETWSRREGATLTVAGYESSGGISGAIAQSAEQLYESLDARERDQCRSLMLRLVELGPDGAPIRRRAAAGPLRADAARARVLARLTSARLVTAEAESVAIAHEALALAWPRLHDWLQQDADAARVLAGVTAAAESWDVAGRPDDELFRGARLQAALERRDAAPDDLTRIEADFLDASAARADAERTELLARAEEDRRRNRRLRSLLGVAAGLILLLVGVGSTAVVTSTEAGAQRDTATVEALVATALALRTSERDVSALLAAEAYRRWPDDARTRSGLTSVLQAAGGLVDTIALEPEGSAYGSLIPGTEEALVVTSGGAAAVRDLADGGTVRALDLGFEPGPPRPWPLVEVSADGRVGAVLWPSRTQPSGVTWYGTSPTSVLVAFDLTGGERLLGPIRLGTGTGALALNRDGSIIAIADARDGAVELVSTTDAAMRSIDGERTTALDRDSYAAAIAFDTAGRLLVGRLDDRVDVIDPRTASVVTRIPVAPSSAHVDLAVAPSGTVVASGDRAVTAFDPATGEVRWATDLSTANLGPCVWIAVSEPHGRVFCSSRFGVTTVFDLASGVPLPSDEFRGSDDVGPLAVGDDGGMLTAIGVGRPVVTRWRIDGDGPGHRLLTRGWEVLGPYSHEDSMLLITPARVERDVWDPAYDAVAMDTRSGTVVHRFPDAVVETGWLRDGRLYARSAADDLFRVFDSRTGTQLGEELWGVVSLWPIDGGEHLLAVRTNGRMRTIDPESGAAEGPAWSVDGYPVWVSSAPDGDPLAVSYLPEVRSREIGPDEPLPQGPIRTAVVSGQDHALRADGLLGLRAHVVTPDDELVGVGDDGIGHYRADSLRRAGIVAGAATGRYAPSFDADGRTVVVTLADGTSIVYDTVSGEPIGDPFRSSGRAVVPAAIRPDGAELAVSTREGVVVWDLDPERQFAAVCRLAGRDLTEAEWHRYLQPLGEPRSTCASAR